MPRREHPIIDVDNSDPVRIEGKRIANLLGEKHPHARWSIFLLAREYGVPWVQEIADLAIAIQQQGGMRTLDGATQRTLGGIFFRLVKDKLTVEVYCDLVPPEGIWKRQAAFVALRKMHARKRAWAAEAAAAASSPPAA